MGRPYKEPMPTLTIDNRSVTVPEGTNVLEAAKRLGIVIPHFCYHEALGAVGACRLCAMTFLEGPVKGLQMSCMIEAQDGMVVSTLDEKAVDLRAHVIEWLMVHHPHDCPVCDEGGECQLQDMTIAGGHGLRRYRGNKRTYENQDLGPFIEQEMNRCIQCYRCVRTYQDYCGGTDFGVLGCNQRIFFGRFREGRLQSHFAGNLADVCPTGVFTDRTFRFRSRYWDLQESPSVCPHCSLGCATIPGARYRELQRTRAGVNREVNGFFICDRGRFGHGYANHPERPRIPRIDGRQAGWEEALPALKGRVEELARRHGADSVAFLGSPRGSLEANYLLRRWARKLGSGRVVFDPHPRRDRVARVTAARLGEYARSLEEIRSSDCAILVGADPLAEAPMLALALRQAVRAGGFVAAFDPRPVTLPCEAAHLPLAPGKLPALLTALGTGGQEGFTRRQAPLIEGVQRRLAQAKRPVLIGGGDLLGEQGASLLFEATRKLSTEERPCGAAMVLGGPGSYGGALLAEEGGDFDALLDAMEAGRIKALVCLETDPFTDHPDPDRAQVALSRLELLAVLDHLPTRSAERADILLPTAAVAENAGTFVNNEGRMLPFEPVLEPGTPIRVTGEGGHPPRTFPARTPGGLPRSAPEVLAELQDEATDLAAVRRELEESDDRFSGLTGLETDGKGVRCAGAGELPPEAPEALAPVRPEGSLLLLPIEIPFGSEALSAFSAPLEPVVPVPHLMLGRGDARRLGIAEGDTILLTTELGHFELPTRLSDRTADGIAFIPRLRGSALEAFVPGGGPLYGRIDKKGGSTWTA